MSGEHHNQTETEGVHQPYNWVKSTAAALAAVTAAQIESEDVSKKALVQNPFEEKVLTDLTPTWTPVSAPNFTVAFTVGTEAADTILVTVQVQDQLGNNWASTFWLFAILCDATTLDAITSAPTGGTDITTGNLVYEMTADIAQIVTTDANGTAVFDITTTGTPSYKLRIFLPNGSVQTSGAITFA